MCQILKQDHLILLDDQFEGIYKLFLFKPNIFRLFPKSGNMHKMDLKQKIRFGLLLIHGYRVYVLGDSQNHVVGCTVFASGKTYRYPFASENDLICGPYFIMPEYRRRGLATKLLSCVIDKYETEYDSIYAHIWHTNRASVLCMEKIGFQEIGMLYTTPILQKCVFSNNGKLILVQKKNPQKQ